MLNFEKSKLLKILNLTTERHGTLILDYKVKQKKYIKLLKIQFSSLKNHTSRSI